MAMLAVILRALLLFLSLFLLSFLSLLALFRGLILVVPLFKLFKLV